MHQHLWPQLEAVPALARLYEEIEQPLVPVLQRMERGGVLIDRAKLRQQSIELAARLKELGAEAQRVAGQEFNVESPRQLQQILFEKLQIPVLRKTPTGQPSTAEDVLEELAAEHALPRLILDFRALAKLRSTYTEKLPEQIDAITGRVHTSYHQAVAATGRLSSTDPNLQNIPIRSLEGRRIRQAFIAPPGQVLISADYSQIELRIMAHLSGDEGLLRAFAADQDIHRATAAEVFGVAPEQVSSDQRRSAKAINFGLIYGMSAFGLARQLGIERAAASQYVELYFARYPGVRRYMDGTRERAKRDGYVETVFGRRLYLPEINSRNRPAAAVCRAQRHQRADAGHGGGHHQARDARRGCLVSAARRLRAPAHAGARRTGARSQRGFSRRGHRASARAHGRRGHVAGAAQGRCRSRPELGRSALGCRNS